MHSVVQNTPQFARTIPSTWGKISVTLAFLISLSLSLPLWCPLQVEWTVWWLTAMWPTTPCPVCFLPQNTRSVSLLSEEVKRAKWSKPLFSQVRVHSNPSLGCRVHDSWEKNVLFWPKQLIASTPIIFTYVWKSEGQRTSTLLPIFVAIFLSTCFIDVVTNKDICISVTPDSHKECL